MNIFDTSKIPEVEIDLSDRRCIRFEILRDIECNGIYFLYDGDEIVYIGKSVFLLGRIASHIREMGNKYAGKSFDRVEYIPVPPEYHKYYEEKLIALYKPRYNKAGVTRPYI